MNSLPARIEALAGRALRLRLISGPLCRLGIALTIFAVVVVWPEPGTPGVLDPKYLLVPNELTRHITGAGHLVARSYEVMEPMDQTIRVQFGLLPVTLWFFWAGTSFLIRSWFWRGLVLFFCWPFVFWITAALTSNVTPVSTLKAGSPWAKTVERSQTSVLDPDAPSVSANLGEVPRRRSRLDISRLRPLDADQARFLFAQQAYHEEQPQKVATHLRVMTGAWTPSGELQRTIVGVMSDYAQAHGQHVGTVAPRIADGRPHQAIRWVVTAWSMRIGVLLIVIGLVLDITGLRRGRAAKRFRAAVDVAA